MKPTLTLLCLIALAACSVDLNTGNTIRAPSGGAAGALGKNYCNTVPVSLNERNRWNSVCFGR